MSSKTRSRTTQPADANESTRTLRSVPARPTIAAVRTDAEDKLWKALHANPKTTSVELSVAAKIGRSTTQKILAKWAGDGSVTRIAGIANGGRRAADKWAITEVDAANVTLAPVGDPPADTDAPHVIDGESGDAPAAMALNPEVSGLESTVGGAESTDRTDTEPTNAQPSITPSHTTQSQLDATAGEPADRGAAIKASAPTKHGADPSHEKRARLAPGALRGMVEDHLRDNPHTKFSPVEIARVLGGKSTGAVSNALDKLVDDGTAVIINNKPRRFALAPTEQTAAATPAN